MKKILLLLSAMILTASASHGATFGLYDSNGLVQEIDLFSSKKTAEKHYKYNHASGHPQGFNNLLGKEKGFVWLYQQSNTGEYSFGQIFGKDKSGSDNWQSVDTWTKVTGSSENPYVSVSDDNGFEFDEHWRTDTFYGTFLFRNNSDGGMISGIKGDDFEIKFEAYGQDGVTSFQFANNGSDPLELNFGEEYTIKAVPVPAGVWLMGTGLAALMGLRRKHA
ncbi:MAG: VPLPA-CTERM sorting domain-containing protein [Desulfobacteraceae bacterium]|nr:VPLPA-CTERM sorting domain-containing protein [Desulfobacteraceae bacterium]